MWMDASRLFIAIVTIASYVFMYRKLLKLNDQNQLRDEHEWQKTVCINNVMKWRIECLRLKVLVLRKRLSSQKSRVSRSRVFRMCRRRRACVQRKRKVSRL